MKQVRPGMDLSRVVLPTFILEPRSFLDKISDYYYHSDIISKVRGLLFRELHIMYDVVFCTLPYMQRRKLPATFYSSSAKLFSRRLQRTNRSCG